MNDLNNVILEGKVTETSGNDEQVMAGIESKRREIYCTYPVKLKGKMLPAAEKLKVGDIIRVVGYLSVSDGKVFIIADHLEVKYK